MRNIIINVICLMLFTYNSAFAQTQPIQTAQLLNFFGNKPTVNYDDLFHEVIERVKSDYVEEVTEKKLYEAALDGMLSSLDPHSTFLSEKDFQDMKISTKGEFGGIGVEVTMEKGFVKVISPYEDGPAFKAGMKVGDFITAVDGQVIKGFSLSQAVEKLRGKPKTRVKVTVFRESTNESLDLNVTREVIKIVPVKARIISDDVALIKITTFSENTASIIKKEYQKMLDQARDRKTDLRGVILDLRWNAGGLLDQSKEVSDLFLEDAVVALTKGRLQESNQILRASGNDITEGLPMVVLVNGGSASASEIVIGAMQDNKRALIVGTKTFGKGSVQTVIPLPGNTGMKLTTARFYTPSGRPIQGHGIEPDVTVEEAVVTPVKDLNLESEMSLNNHLQTEQDLTKKVKEKSRIKIPSLSDKESEDFQLLRAIDIVKGMALYSERLSN